MHADAPLGITPTVFTARISLAKGTREIIADHWGLLLTLLLELCYCGTCYLGPLMSERE